MSKLEVKTRHSRYLIDSENQTAQRLPFHEDANDLSGFGFGSLDEPGEVKRYINLLHVAVDEPLILQYEDGSWSRSTLVRSIIDLADEPEPVA